MTRTQDTPAAARPKGGSTAREAAQAAKRNAERQRRYRERAFQDPDGLLLARLNLAVDATAKAQLERLARHYRVTQRAVIEKLLASAEERVLKSLSPEDHPGYYSRPT